MDDYKAQQFADALTALCRRHGVMIWTAFETTPIMASEVTEGDHFKYEVETPEFGSSAIIARRLLAGAR
jgi:hypothetical protein